MLEKGGRRGEIETYLDKGVHEHGKDMLRRLIKLATRVYEIKVFMFYNVVLYIVMNCNVFLFNNKPHARQTTLFRR